MTSGGSRTWSATWRAFYGLVRLLGPFIRLYLALGAWGLERFVEVQVVGRRTGRPRSVLLTLLTDAGRGYIGHPNGDAAWVRNLDAAGEVVIVAGGARTRMRAVRVGGPEREAVIRLTPRQQPFPANLLYRAARGHILAVGSYFRLEPVPT